jgi:tetratricopeptide (TPR) repeat protein
MRRSAGRPNFEVVKLCCAGILIVLSLASLAGSQQSAAEEGEKKAFAAYQDSQAIRFDPALAEAYGNRGLTRLRLSQVQGSMLGEPDRRRAQTPSGCPTGGEWRRLEPDPDLRAWPVVRDIGDANRVSGLQRVMQARLCEKAGEYERAANYYYEAHEGLIQAVPRAQLDELLARSTALRAGFSFDAIRIQLSTEAGSPAVSRVRDGQDFYTQFVVEFFKRIQMELRYTIRTREGGEAGHFSGSTDFAGAAAHGTYTNLIVGRLNLPKDVSISERTFEIIGWVTVNGVTQTRQMSLTIYR